MNSPFDTPPFVETAAVKIPRLLDGLNDLTRLHLASSEAYARMLTAVFGPFQPAERIEDIPWLPVRLFKRLELRSVPKEKITKILMSSGTSGQSVSRIFLDAETAALQTRALARISAEFLGSGRSPMVIIDDRSFLQDRSRFNARAAGILGFSNLGRNHFYLLDDQLRPDWKALREWLAAQGDTPILLFGFTFVVWQQFVVAAQRAGVSIRFPAESRLIHGGGWKRLEDQRVSSATFKAALAETFGIDHVHNYYGMVEQVGSIFFECEAGHLHTPAYADIVIRDPQTLAPLDVGAPGLIQVLSLLPRSYPGHSLLTEDIGVVSGIDDCPCGRHGKTFAVHGRIKNVEIRGCSDTRTVP